jgi:hypothetical protein
MTHEQQLTQASSSLEELVRLHPHNARRLLIMVHEFGIDDDDGPESDRVQTSYLSPYGIEFSANRNFPPGMLLKVLIPIPDYWRRKQRLVTYKRIDVPMTLQLLAKVVSCQERGKFGRKKVVLVETVNIDKVDEEVLKEYLNEDKSSRHNYGEKLEVNFG